MKRKYFSIILFLILAMFICIAVFWCKDFLATYFSPYNPGIKLYQEGHLHEAKIQLMKVAPQDKKYAEAQNILSIINQDPNNDGYLKKMNQYKTLYAKQVDEQYKESQRIMKEWKRDQENAENYDEVAFKLASIDKGKIINRDDVSVNRFRYLLQILDDKTLETKVQIADMTVKAQQILRDEYGKEVSLLFLMEKVNDSIPSGANIKYAEIITAYLLMIK
jgi:hypothetical protein